MDRFVCVAPPPPTSPIEGEVSLHSWGTMLPRALNSTSPWMGEAGRGWGRLCRAENGPRIKSEGGTVGGSGDGTVPPSLRLWHDLEMDAGSRPG